jgi:hypothetical protein
LPTELAGPMPATIDHECFTQPRSAYTRLWRYMDFTKYVAMLDSGSLSFVRSDRFKDPFEGSFSRANVAMRPGMYKHVAADPDQFAAFQSQLSQVAQALRPCTYISCWHANEHESAAMWDLYAKTEEAVAVETSYQLLLDALPEESYLGMVRYIDYQKDWLPEGNTFYPYVHKRKSFEHEREVRAVIQDFDLMPASPGLPTNETPLVRQVPVNLSRLVSTVHVSPTAPDWFGDLVSSVSLKFGLAAPVRKSDLYSSPVF